VTHPLLEGADGIALDEARQHLGGRERAQRHRGRHARRQDRRSVSQRAEFYDPPAKRGPLETPTSPFLLDYKFCTANSDGNRRDNSPNNEGDSGPTPSRRARFPAWTSACHPGNAAAAVAARSLK